MSTQASAYGSGGEGRAPSAHAGPGGEVRAPSAYAGPGGRGLIALIEENCTSCDVCARECPAWCITIESHAETDNSTATGRGRARAYQVLDRFEIDYALCMFCGICIDVCPFDALEWVAATVPPARARPALVVGKDTLDAWNTR